MNTLYDSVLFLKWCFLYPFFSHGNVMLRDFMFCSFDYKHPLENVSILSLHPLPEA